jgi:hypothetical protein
VAGAFGGATLPRRRALEYPESRAGADGYQTIESPLERLKAALVQNVAGVFRYQSW